jgi:hypothetical protein
MPKMASSGRKMVTHFIKPVKKNAMAAGLEATNMLVIRLTMMARNM